VSASATPTRKTADNQQLTGPANDRTALFKKMIARDYLRYALDRLCVRILMCSQRPGQSTDSSAVCTTACTPDSHYNEQIAFPTTDNHSNTKEA
jgi:hypothetical protein